MNSPPTTLGKYQIIREIARSNDIVYEAYDPLMNRRVALKELAIPGGSTPQQRDERVKRFQREVKAAGSLAHPNIVTIYEVGADGDRHFMAMEYLDGRTLRNELDTHGLLPLARAVEIATCVLKGLEAAHSHGVIHRDIKPENIQLLDDGRVKLTDFGIARLTFEPNLTMDGQVFGTPSYMSPEQVIGKDIDARSDLFSVGSVLYEMLAGRKAFAGDNVVTITHAITSREPDPLVNCPQPLARVIDRALEKSALARFPTAGDMLSALEYATSPDALAPAPPSTYSYGSPSPSPGAPPILAPGPPSYPQPMQGSYPPHPYPHAAYPSAPTSYSYNPYGAPGHGPAGPSYAPGPMPLPQIPIYYPPPPRQPLMKPETKHFLGRLFLTLLVVGTLLALVFVGLSSIGTAVDRMEEGRTNDMIRDKNPLEGDLDQKIASKEGLVNKVEGSVGRLEEKIGLARLYGEKAQVLLQQGDFAAAEEHLKRAIENDPKAAPYRADLGKLYGLLAPSSSPTSTRMDLWEKAGNCYSDAADLESIARNREQYKTLGATAYLNAAEEALGQGDPRSSRLAQLGRELAEPGSEVYQRALNLLAQAGG